MEELTGVEDGGHTHQPRSLRTGDKPLPPNTPQISELFVCDWEGAQKCFILRDQTTEGIKSHHLPAQVTLTALSVPHGHIFFQQSCNVM